MNTTLSLRGENASDRRGNPLHAIDAFRQSGSLPAPSGSPRAYALAMTRCERDLSQG
ncbi:MAG: hypothetical protein ACJZ72_12315 [Opitutales bacterium]